MWAMSVQQRQNRPCPRPTAATAVSPQQALAVMAASLFIFLACPGTGASTLSQKGDRLLCQAAETRNAARAQVIVKLDGSLTPAREGEIKSLGADIYRHLPLLHLAAVRIPVRNV